MKTNYQEDLFSFTRHDLGKVWSGVVQEGQALWLPAGFFFTGLMCSASSSGGAVGCAGLKLCGLSPRPLHRLERLQAGLELEDRAVQPRPDPSKHQSFYDILSAIFCSLTYVFLSSCDVSDL